MKKFLLVILLIFDANLFVHSQKLQAKDILLKSASVLKEHKSFVYDADYLIKMFDNQDTIKFPKYSCEVLCVPEDTILGYYARIFNKNEERIYDGKNFSLIWHDVKSVTIDYPAENGKNCAYQNIRKECIPGFFVSETPLEVYLNEGQNWKLCEDSFQNIKVWKIEFNLAANDEITFLKKIIWINKNTYIPVKVESFAKYRDIQDEYKCLELSENIKLDILQKSSFNSNSYPEDYKVEFFVPPNVQKSQLSIGTSIINFEAVDTSGNKIFIDSAFVTDKLILFDFWYLGCAACVKALPLINRLYVSYKDKDFMVFGLNPIDKIDNKLAEINKFIKKFDIKYQLLFISKPLLKEFKVNTFPTLYLIKNGKVIFSASDSCESTLTELENVIKENLKFK